jgi:hypothetical protein
MAVTVPEPTRRSPSFVWPEESTLVDNGGGSYTYTFKRSITGGAGSQQAIVAAATDSGNNRKADLGDLSYDPNLTHRVAIQLSGSRLDATN